MVRSAKLPLDSELTKDECIFERSVMVALKAPGLAAVSSGHIDAEDERMPVRFGGTQLGDPFGGLVILDL
jgi:hypothetical protein